MLLSPTCCQESVRCSCEAALSASFTVLEVSSSVPVLRVQSAPQVTRGKVVHVHLAMAWHCYSTGTCSWEQRVQERTGPSVGRAAAPNNLCSIAKWRKNPFQDVSTVHHYANLIPPIPAPIPHCQGWQSIWSSLALRRDLPALHNTPCISGLQELLMSLQGPGCSWEILSNSPATHTSSRESFPCNKIRPLPKPKGLKPVPVPGSVGCSAPLCTSLVMLGPEVLVPVLWLSGCSVSCCCMSLMSFSAKVASSRKSGETCLH